MTKYQKLLYVIMIGLFCLQTISVKTMEKPKEKINKKAKNFDYKPLDEKLYKEKAKKFVKKLQVTSPNEYAEIEEYLNTRIDRSNNILSGNFTKEQMEIEFGIRLKHNEIYCYVCNYLNSDSFARAMYYFAKTVYKNLIFIMTEGEKVKFIEESEKEETEKDLDSKGWNEGITMVVLLKESKRFASYAIKEISNHKKTLSKK